jgi:mannose-1-phosphate guanylyltransferase/phosphomannomutase
MIPLANRPIMEYIIELLKKHGIRSIIILLYYQPEVIQNHFKRGRRFGVSLTYINAYEDFGTAGSVKNAERYLDEPFIVISGDILTNFDLAPAINFHKERGGIATIILTRVKDPLPYGIVITDDRRRIVRFLEKPTWGEVFSDTINTGIYILNPDVFKHIPDQEPFDFSKDLFPKILKEKIPIFGYTCKGYWRDIGNLNDYLIAHYDILRRKIHVDIQGRCIRSTIGREVWVNEDTKIEEGVEFRGGVVIGKGCRIAKGVRLSNCFIGDGTIIGKDTNINNSVVWERVRIGKGVELKENIVGRGSNIKDGAFLGSGAVVGERCVIGRKGEVRANVKIWPDKIVEDGATLSTSLVWGEKWSRSLFGTHGVSGLANVEISPEFASKLGAAYGASFPKNSLLLTSRTTDKVCRVVNRAIMSGILSVGLNVGDLRTLPTPVARHQIRTSRALGGIHIRRAPRGQSLVEIQFFDRDGLDIPPSKEKAIEQLFFREDFRRAEAEETGELSFPDRVIEYYRDAFLDNIDTELIRKRRFKIVIDYGFGESVDIFPSIIGEFGCDVISLNAHLDPTRAITSPDDIESAMEQLSDIVLTLSADIGILLDSEAEMAFFVDDEGKIISNDLALAIMAWLVGRCYPNEWVAVPATATKVIEEIAPKVRRTRTTSRAMMNEKDVYMVGNSRGGFIFPRFQQAFDAMFAAAKILELLALNEITLSEVAKKIPPFYLVHERVPCPWEAKGKIMRHLIELTSGERVELVDGIKVYYGTDWVFLLPSTNRAIFHVFAEASSHKEAKALSKRYVAEIRRQVDEA